VTWQASAVDVWVLKVVLYAFVTGALPFQGSAYYQVYDIVVFGEYFVQSFRVYLPAKDDVCMTSMEQVISGGKVKCVLTLLQ
jgi:serine/threonine protein kinase